MSADNGVYILKTADNQYRVATFQAVDNLYYNDANNTAGELCSLQLLLTYGKAKYTKKLEVALKIAHNILKKLWICEYGIQVIESNKTWNNICKEAQKEAKIIITNKDRLWLYNEEQLQLIADGKIS